MNTKQIFDIAKQAGFADSEIIDCQLILEFFATMVAQQEREACAKIVDDYIGFHNKLSKDIRARGQA
jgi:hypothetical protein